VKYLVTFSFLLCLISPLLAEEIYLRDVPEGHYAYEAVYDLIQQGVTSGFPDGTYRGNKTMNRYEIAAFISKLATSKTVARASNEKLVAELRSEIDLAQYTHQQARQATQISGSLQGRWRYGQTSTSHGGKADYRWQSQLVRRLADDTQLTIYFDTLDAGYGGASRDLVREMLAFEGKTRLAGLNLRVTAGPGDVIHLDDGLFPFDNNIRFIKPRRAFYLSGNLAQAELSLGVLARSTYASGELAVMEYSPKMLASVGGGKFLVNPRCFTSRSQASDWRLDLGGEFSQAEIKINGLFGIAKGTNYPHGLYVMGNLEIGRNWRFLVQKIGSQYREQYSYGIYDLFNRNINDGSTSFGLQAYQPVNAPWYLAAKGDYTSPGPVTTLEMKLGYQLGKYNSLELVYQSYQATTPSQAVGLAFNASY